MSAHHSTWITPDQAREALKIGTGRGIKIAVLDSGVELSHPVLRHIRLVDDIGFDVNDKEIENLTLDAGRVNTYKPVPGWGVDVKGHGTAVAAIIHRIAPEIQLGSFRVLNQNNNGHSLIIKEAARMAVDRGYHILNCSLGVKASENKLINFKQWVDMAYRRGVHVVSACSNNNFREPEWPGFFPTVITVNMAKTLSDEFFFRWDVKNNNYSEHLVEFAARGDEVEVAWQGGTMKTLCGSSFAAPHVAGLLARLLSVYPHLKPPVAKALLQEIALPWTEEIMARNG